MTLYGLVEAVYNKHMDNHAVLYDNGEIQNSISYRQLWDISCQVKKLLCGRENEVVGLCLRIDHRMPAILLGILGCNAAFYNFDVNGFIYAAQVLEEIGAQVVLIHQHFIQAVQTNLDILGGISTPLDIPGLEDYTVVKFTSIARKKHAAGLAYCITTSGTTGKPKVVMVPHQCIVPNVTHLRKLFSLTSADLVLAATALTFDPSIVEIFMTLSVGACLLIVPPAVKMMPDLLLEMIHERNKVTVNQITPTLLSRFKASRLSQTILGDNSVMRVVALGGEKFPSCTWLHSMISPSNKTKFYNLYGTTEVSCWATCYQVSGEDLRKGIEIPLGEPLQETDVEVRDDKGNIVTEGEGTLWIGGRRRQCKLCVMEEELQFDRQVLRDTGDIVHIRADGKLYYIGRRDQQKKRNGRRIDLEEIKMVGRRNKLVHDCEVMLIHDQLVVFIVSQQSVVKDVKVIDMYMKEHLPSHWWPDSLIVISKLPVTEHGKVDFKSLELIHKERQTSTCMRDIADYLTTKWKELTSQYTGAQIGDTEKFILAGGDSIKAVQLANIIENHLCLQLPLLIDMILHKTYSEVRRYLTTELEDSARQVNNSISKGSKAVLSVVSDAPTDESGDVHEIRNNMKVRVGKHHADSKDASGVDLSQKRKFLEDGMENKVTKLMNDFQFSVSRCNRFNKHAENMVKQIEHEIMAEKLEKGHKKMVENVEKEHDVKVCYTEVSKNCKATGNCDLHMEEVWRYDTGKCVDASPLMAIMASNEYIVMIGSHSHKFVAILGSTGDKQWEITLPDRIESSACLSACGNFVIVGCYDGKVYVLHVDNGEIWWQIETGSQVKCSPVVDTQTGLAYIGSHSQTVYCFDVNVCEVVWQRDLESGSILSSPTISCYPHQLYIATLGGQMFALNPVNGVSLWKYNFPKPVFSSPAVTEVGVVVGCTDTYLYHLSYTGELLWKYSTGGYIFSSPSLGRLNISASDNLCSLDGTSENDLAKTVSTDFGIEARDVADWAKYSNRGSGMNNLNGYIVVGSHDKCLYCISNIGELVWKLQVDSEVYSSPFQCYIDMNNYNIKTDSSLHVVLFASTVGTLYIVHVPTGKILCTKNLDGEIFSSPVVYKNFIVVGCRNDFVYCFKIS